jgi:probable phosphoglycerate mutase
MRRIVLLRHGLTSWNAEGRLQGQADTELTETGVLQAKSAAAALAAYAPSVLWSSDLTRARVTASALEQACGLSARLDERLREIHVGALQGLTHAEAVEAYGLGPWDYSAHGGESDTATGSRMAEVIGEVAAELGDGQTAVLVSHGSSIRSGALTFLGWPLEQIAALGALTNCGWVELVDEQSTWARRAPWRMAAYNRVAPIS